MLTISVALKEQFNDDTQMWETSESFDLDLEHSLASMSKWEQFFERPFLSSDKTPEETFVYITMMICTPKVPPVVLSKLSKENFEEISRYIHAKMTATWFREDPTQKPNREIITAEVIYHWMVHYNIWLEAEHWHLNKLLTLIRVCTEKAKPPKKMNRQQQTAERQRLNAERLAKQKGGK